MWRNTDSPFLDLTKEHSTHSFLSVHRVHEGEDKAGSSAYAMDRVAEPRRTQVREPRQQHNLEIQALSLQLKAACVASSLLIIRNVRQHSLTQ